MKPLLKSNVKKSFILAEKINFSIPLNLIEIKGNKDSEVLAMLYSSKAIQDPCFFREKNNEISSIQKDYFGIYALKNIIRHTFISIPFLKAALEPKSIPRTPGIMLHYRGCFHLVIAYLSLYGRILVDRVQGTPYVVFNEQKEIELEKRVKSTGGAGYKILENCPGYIFAILTRSNRWVFEGRNRSHKTIWRELKPVFRELKEIPDEFLGILDYLTSYGPHQVEDEKELMETGLELIAEARHMASYSGYGEDDFAVDSLLNQEDWISGNALNLKLDAFSKFSTSLLDTVSKELVDLINSIRDPKDRIKRFMFFMLSSSPFDLACWPSWENSADICDRLNNILEWLFLPLIDKDLRKKYTLHSKSED